MGYRNTEQSYGSVSKLFHWFMAILIVGLLVVGLVMTGMEDSPDKFKVYGLHKSIGIIVLALATLRLLWKLRSISPLLPVTMTNIEKFMARAGHAALYVLMFAMPFSGWFMSSAAGFTVSVFGWFTLPNMVAPDKELSHFFRDAHSIIGYSIIGLVLLHVAAALLHHFYYRDNVLVRMLPFKRGPLP